MIEEKISSKKEEVKNSSGKRRKALVDLTFSDNFMFTNLMEDKEICVYIASALLDIDIEDLEYQETEKTLNVLYDSKSVRFDCLIKSEGKIINIEMQVNDTGDIIFRARYYHIIIGMNNLSVGNDYINLPASYVIFICKFDPFDKNAVKYHFQSYDENAKIFEQNKAHTLYFNTKALDTLEEGRLKEVLKLSENIPSDDEFALKVQNKIKEIKSNVKMQKEFMKHSADLMDEKREGISIGRTEGIEVGTEKTKLENAINLLDILDDETIASKIGLDIDIVKKLRSEQ